MGVQIIAPERVRAGEKLDVRVIVTGEDGTKADKITLRLFGEMQVVIAGTVKKTLLDRTITFVETQTILGERMEYTASFDIPTNACASCEEGLSSSFVIVWKLLFHIDIPWRIDVNEERVVLVDFPEAVERPSAEDWHSAFAWKSGVRAEVLLDDHFLAPGEEVNAALALFNVIVVVARLRMRLPFEHLALTKAQAELAPHRGIAASL